MNRKLSDRQITEVCRELLARDPETSGRALRAELRRRFDSPGKTDRVFAVWRTVRGAGKGRAGNGRFVEDLKRRVSELEARLRDSELARESAGQRALLSEAREVAHQDRWAHEIHTLRGEVRQLTEDRSRRVELELRVLDLSREILQLRARLAEPSSLAGPPVAGG